MVFYHDLLQHLSARYWPPLLADGFSPIKKHFWKKNYIDCQRFDQNQI
jgi:hypothetical protein